MAELGMTADAEPRGLGREGPGQGREQALHGQLVAEDRGLAGSPEQPAAALARIRTAMTVGAFARADILPPPS